MLLTAIAIILCLFSIFMPVFGIFFGLQSGRNKGYRKDTTYTASQDITYYRDLLEDISPAAISILMDLRVEDNKDIAATLLRLYDKQMVRFEDDRIIPTGNQAELDKGEQELMQMLFGGGIAKNALKRWKQNRLYDAVNDGYIRRTSIKVGQRSCLLGCGSGCLTAIFLALACFLVVTFAIPNDAFFEKVDLVATQIDERGYFIESDLGILSGLVMRFVIMMGLLDLFMLLPSFMLFRFFGYYTARKGFVFERTPLGNELAEKIAGLQRFIHEFSSLSEAVKEQVVLWNDFLVYAVVLEENEIIVNDISKLYKINLRKFMKPFR
jgi:hypothetical protein